MALRPPLTDTVLIQLPLQDIIYSDLLPSLVKARVHHTTSLFYNSFKRSLLLSLKFLATSEQVIRKCRPTLARIQESCASRL